MVTEVGLSFKCQQLIKAFYVLGTRRIIMVKVWFNRHKYIYIYVSVSGKETCQWAMKCTAIRIEI